MSLHIVQPGDTLSAIAARFGLSTSALAMANPQITNPNLIFVGQAITIPDDSEPMTALPPSPQDVFKKHHVAPGDTLQKIANAFGISLQRLLEANPQIANPNLIFVDQIITVPPATASLGPISPIDPGDSSEYPFDLLTNGSDEFFGFAAISPRCLWLGDRHGIDGRILTAIVAQESGFKNWRVHLDGTGHGLIGLDDNGLLPDFERWSGQRFGRGAMAESIPPDLQLKFLAKTISEFSREFADTFAATRCWHRGHGFMNDRLGSRYEALIRAHILQLYG